MNKSAPPQSRRGRRPGGEDTREAVLAAARRRFLADGYHDVSLRSVATEAGVDVALIGYFFGSKQGLFGAAMQLPVNPAEAIAEVLPGDLDGLPERLLRRLLTVWDEAAYRGPLRAMLSVAGQDPAMTRLLREMIERELITPIAARIGGRNAKQRAGVFAAQLSGVVFSRYLIGVEPIASASVDQIVRYLAPALRTVLRP